MNKILKNIALILIQAILMADCALAGQGTFLLNEQQEVPAMLSPQVQININAFQAIYQQCILYPEVKEPLRKSKSTEIYSIGGNSLLRGEDVKGLMPWEKDDWQKISDIQKYRIKETLKHIVPELKNGGIITHGNGPEAGAVLERWLGRFLDGNTDQEFINQKLAQGVKETQEWIGADIKEALMSLGIPENQIEVVMTDVRVDAEDEGFTHPKKPIGLARFKTVNGKEEPIPRVLVASPKPKSIVQIDEIKKAIKDKKIVICVGGGGIAVDMNNQARSLPAVIDKDLATACLAESLFKSRNSAEQKPLSRVIISTDVDRVYLDYGRSTQRPIRKISADRLQQYIDSGEFAGTEGSMLPKLQAAIIIIKSGAAKEVIITNPENLSEIDKGGLHTRIERSPKNSFDKKGLYEKKTPQPISAYPQQAGKELASDHFIEKLKLMIAEDELMKNDQRWEKIILLVQKYNNDELAFFELLEQAEILIRAGKNALNPVQRKVWRLFRHEYQRIHSYNAFKKDKPTLLFIHGLGSNPVESFNQVFKDLDQKYNIVFFLYDDYADFLESANSLICEWDIFSAGHEIKEPIGIVAYSAGITILGQAVFSDKHIFKDAVLVQIAPLPGGSWQYESLSPNKEGYKGKKKLLLPYKHIGFALHPASEMQKHIASLEFQEIFQSRFFSICSFFDPDDIHYFMKKNALNEVVAVYQKAFEDFLKKNPVVINSTASDLVFDRKEIHQKLPGNPIVRKMLSVFLNSSFVRYKMSKQVSFSVNPVIFEPNISSIFQSI